MVDKRLIEIDERFKESFLKRIVNRSLVILLILISYLPFWIIYGISDLFFLIIRYVVGYRKKVILDNLAKCFPSKSKAERKRIMSKFYRHFCDFALESVKMYSMTPRQMARRLTVKGMDVLNNFADQGKSVIVLGMHYNNWEWGSYLQTQAKHQVLMVYNSIRGNASMEKFILHSREKWGGQSIPMYRSVRAIMEYMRKGKPAILWLAADQTPPPTTPFWTIFLNRETPFFSGPEKIGIKTNQPIVFIYLKKLSRGKYEANISVLAEEPNKLQPNEILLRYSRKMEEIILKEPEYYLWSHRRWKYTRPENVELIN